MVPMTGWQRPITTTLRIANRAGIGLRRRPADGRLLFDPSNENHQPRRRARSRDRHTGLGAQWGRSAKPAAAQATPSSSAAATRIVLLAVRPCVYPLRSASRKSWSHFRSSGCQPVQKLPDPRRHFRRRVHLGLLVDEV